ncbi:MAG: UbiA family prenyltransferase [Candidatus Heimdallarchaeota archaeon]
MSKGFKLLRAEYLFSVLIPCLLCIYLNNYDIITHIWILAGFGFYAITGNTLNDVIDMKNPKEKETLERIKGYQRKEILVLALSSFTLGTLCFVNEIFNTPILAVYLAIIVFMVIFYCFFKKLVIINHIILGISHIFLPYFMVKINAGDTLLSYFPNLSISEWLIIIPVAAAGFVGQMLHEMIDGDALSRLKPRSSQIVMWIASLVTLGISLTSIIITQYLFVLPVLIFPFGVLYIFRKPRKDLLGRTSLKDTGIILGNLIFIYILILILAS